MKIAIVGAGGVGGYYGALLAKAGHDVVFLARGPHLQAIREHGLRIKSVWGDFDVSLVNATEHPSEIGPVDLVLVAVKTYHLDEAAQTLPAMIADETVVLPLENGVDSAERLSAVIDPKHLIGGATWISVAIEEPGVIGQYSQFRRVAIGEWNGETTPRLKRIYDAFQATGVSIEISTDIRTVLWSKLVFIASVGAVGSLTGVTFGEFRHVPETRKVLLTAIAEVIAVARANGAKIEDGMQEATLDFIDNSAADIKTSLQRDIESGRIGEVESMIGVIVRLGEEKKVSTPIMSFAYAMLKPKLLIAQRKVKHSTGGTLNNRY